MRDTKISANTELSMITFGAYAVYAAVNYKAIAALFKRLFGGKRGGRAAQPDTELSMITNTTLAINAIKRSNAYAHSANNAIPTFFIILFYFPGCWILDKWIPKYSESLIYLGILPKTSSSQRHCIIIFALPIMSIADQFASIKIMPDATLTLISLNASDGLIILPRYKPRLKLTPVLSYSKYDYEELDKARLRSQFATLLIFTGAVTVIAGSF